jgi:ubiquinone/menaquinone biosynthesis C-methylase UbiE
MTDGRAVPPEIVTYYERYDEGARCFHGAGQLEFTRTLDILGRHLPTAPAKILDVGGGPAVYAVELALQGYHVELIDPVVRHIEKATQAAKSRGTILASCSQGDASRLQFQGEAMDAVLMLGPLYHLPAKEDRLHALAETYRVLRPGGVIVAAGISRFASALDGIFRGCISDPAFGDIVERDLLTGEHSNPTSDISNFTTAFFHRPCELRGEVESAGFQHVALLAVEGPVWIVHDFDGRWIDLVWRRRVLEVLRTIEAEPEIMGASAHIIEVARKTRQ